MNEDIIDDETEDLRGKHEVDLKEGVGHVKFGVGVGAASAASLLLIGTTCPLCFFVAPAMVAVGLHKRHKAKKALDAMGEKSEPDLKINFPDLA